MNYNIVMGDGTAKIIKFTSSEFKKLKVWSVCFEDGKEAILYKCGNDWLQRTEDNLDINSLLIIGKHIDCMDLVI